MCIRDSLRTLCEQTKSIQRANSEYADADANADILGISGDTLGYLGDILGLSWWCLSEGFVWDIFGISRGYLWNILGIFEGFVWNILQEPCEVLWNHREHMSERTLVHRRAMSIYRIRVMNILNNLVGISLRSIRRVESTLQLKTILSGDSIIDLNIYQ